VDTQKKQILIDNQSQIKNYEVLGAIKDIFNQYCRFPKSKMTKFTHYVFDVNVLIEETETEVKFILTDFS